MRISSVVLTVLVSVGAAGVVNAQDRQSRFVERIQDLDLTEQQEAKIAEIQKESRAEVEQAAQALAKLAKEEESKIQEVLTPEQQKKVEALRDEREDRKDRREECLSHAVARLKELDLTDAEMAKIGEIRSDLRPRVAETLKELEGLLTPDQKKTREEALKAGKTRRQVVEALKLTDEQKEKFASVGKALRSEVGDEVEQIQGVLTSAEQEKLEDLKSERKEHVRDRRAYRIANLQDLDLTDEQKSKISDIRQEYRPKVREAGNKLRAAVRDELGQIITVIKG